MLFYKLLSVDLTSFADIDSDFKVQYQVGKFVYPKVPKTKLYVFKSLDDAKSFRNYSHYCPIFECEVINPKKCKTLSIYYKLVDFYKLKFAKHSIKELSKDAPTGTYMCDAVKLLREVED